MPFCRNGPKLLGICLAMPTCVLPPIGGLDTSAAASPQASHRWAEYEAYIYGRQPLATRSDCHRPCPNTGAEVPLPLAADAPPPPPPAWPSTVSCHGCWLRSPRPLADHPSLQPIGYASPPSCHGRLDWGQPGPPQTGLTHSCICGLPFPIHPAQFLTLVDQNGPDVVKDPQPDPALESPMHRTIVAEFLGQLVPLHPAAHTIDNAIQRTSLVNPLAPHRLGRVILSKDPFELCPKVIWYSPDRRQWFNISLSSGHLAPPVSAISRHNYTTELGF